MKSTHSLLPKILNFLIYFFPLSFILGNFIINVTLLLISIFGILHYKSKIFNFKKNKPLILIIIFFLLVFLSTLIEVSTSRENGYLLKSIVFFRYFVFLIVVRCMFLNGDINFKKFFLFCIFLSSFVAIDVIFQKFVGVDFFGLRPSDSFAGIIYSGMFGKEAIAGSYIQRFAVIGCFSIPWLFNKNYKKSFSIFILLLGICFFGTLISGNRIPTLMFVFFFFLISIIFAVKKINYTTIVISFLLVASFGLVLMNNSEIKKRYHGFLIAMPRVSVIVTELKKNYPELEKYKNTKTWSELTETKEYKILDKDKSHNLLFRSGHTQVYITSVDLFTDNPFLGRGIKSFRYTCHEKLHLPNRTCQNHPHHYYLEILNDTGIVGFGIIVIALFILVFKNFKKYFINYSRGNLNLIFYATFLALVIEFFPLRSHGSFFSVWNAAYIFFLIGVFSALYDLNSKKLLKKFNF